MTTNERGLKINGEYIGERGLLPIVNSLPSEGGYQDSSSYKYSTIEDFSIRDDGGNNNVSVANEITAYPIYIPVDIKYRALVMRSNGTGTGNVNFGIYTDDGNGYPKDLVTPADLVFDSSFNTHNTFEIDGWLKRGLYWGASVANGAASLIGKNSTQGYGIGTNILGISNVANNQSLRILSYWKVAYVYTGEMPKVFPSSATPIDNSFTSGIGTIGFGGCKAVRNQQYAPSVIRVNGKSTQDDIKFLTPYGIWRKDPNVWVSLGSLASENLANSMGANILVFKPFLISKKIKFRSAGIRVSSAVAASLVKVAIYTAEYEAINWNVAGERDMEAFISPDKKISSEVVFDTSVTGFRQADFAYDVELPIGWYFIATISNAAPTVRSFSEGGGYTVCGAGFDTKVSGFRISSFGYTNELPHRLQGKQEILSQAVAQLPQLFVNLK